MLLPPSHFDQVCDFHVQCGVILPATPQRDLFTTNPTLIDKAVGFIQEEYEEYLVAIANQDQKEMLDALIDISYFTLRLSALLGTNMDLVEFDHPEWCDVIIDMVGKTCYTVIKQRLDDIQHHVEQHDYDGLIHALYNMEVTVEKIGIQLLSHQHDKDAFRVDKWNEAFRMIHHNNMSKLCDSEDEAIKTVASYDNHDVYKRVGYRLAPDNHHYVVFDLDTGKILKSIKWVQVDLNSFFD